MLRSCAMPTLPLLAALTALCLPLMFPAARAADADPFAPPPELAPDIRFWIRVYTEVTTEQGLLHDDRDLGLVYEVLRFEADDSAAQRERRVNAAKARYAELLKRFAAGSTDQLTAHERRILHAFGEQATPASYRDAIERIRFQLGQADRFRDGLIRAQGYERAISKILSARGVPAEIGAVPHVESSFNPGAYSKVGAAGLWQFMPATAKRFMRVDSLVDQRLDPYVATEAAANLMLYNYRLLGSWPLTITAYNHGPGGLKRAQDELGTDSIAVIVKRYHGATFGFASRNFYLCFLAALEVDHNAETYFGPMTHLPDTQNTLVELPDYIAVETLARAFKVDLGALKVLNPALRPPIWSGARFVPRGYELRVPSAMPPAEISAAWGRVAPTQRYLAQRNDGLHTMRRGETLAGIAAASGVPLPRLLAANNLSGSSAVGRGTAIRIALPGTRGGAGAPPPAVELATAAAAIETPQPPAAEVRATASSREPVVERQAATPALLPGAAPTTNTDASNYTVGADHRVVVQPGETLGHLAEWLKINSAQLRALNRLRSNSLVGLGRRIKLDFSHVTPEAFTAARRSYHKDQQDAFFATHRIAGTDTYTIRKGDSLWLIAQQHGDLPVWLVSQYNPDVNFGDMRPGTAIALPKIVPINRE